MNPTLQNILDYQIGYLSTESILIAFGVFLGLLIIFRIFHWIALNRIRKWAERTVTDLDDTLVELLIGIPHHVYVAISFYVAWYYLYIQNPLVNRIVTGILLIILVHRAIIIIENLSRYLVRKMWARSEKELVENITAIQGINMIIRIILWAAGLLLILSNLGINISALIASLGIGGVAIAFAMQNVLEDLFSSFAIYFDKPFQVGDYVAIGSDMGTVKKIGLKTTRLETLHGEEMVISNTELTSARIQNYKKMKRRRIVFGLGVTYDTPTVKMEKIPTIIEEILKKEDLVQVDRIHFKSFGDFSLNFEIVYYLDSSDYRQYLDIQQRVNLEIMRQFEKEEIEIAYPTQMVYVRK